MQNELIPKMTLKCKKLSLKILISQRQKYGQDKSRRGWREGGRVGDH